MNVYYKNKKLVGILDFSPHIFLYMNNVSISNIYTNIFCFFVFLYIFCCCLIIIIINIAMIRRTIASGTLHKNN